MSDCDLSQSRSEDLVDAEEREREDKESSG